MTNEIRIACCPRNLSFRLIRCSWPALPTVLCHGRRPSKMPRAIHWPMGALDSTEVLMESVSIRTIFISPELTLVHGDNEMPHEILGQLGALYITHHRIPGASNSSLPSVFKPKPQIISLTSVQFTPRNELVCWMSLLDQLRQMAEYSTPKGRYCGIHSWSPQIASPLEVRMSIPAFSREGFLVGELLKTPAVIFRERSWDFMP